MPAAKFIEDNCKNRIKPALLRDVKTEALLVFCRTALERYFSKLKEAGVKPVVGTEDETAYVYEMLWQLLLNLQECVVNVDYILNLVQQAPKHPILNTLYQQEKPLIEYYNAMARAIAQYYEGEPAYLPEFLVLCALSHWILEEEKSVHLYPFLKEVDFLELIGKFESNRKEFEKNGTCQIGAIHDIASKVIKKLKNKKYKVKKKQTLDKKNRR